MATIIYLDAEDEITSAATRIRGAGETRVALVVPFGSRLATSRINFRLLAREALVNGRRLDIVAPDASARALAASAGLPVYASIGEFESALDRPPVEPVSDGAATVPLGAAAIAAARDAGAAPAGETLSLPPEAVPVQRPERSAGTPKVVQNPRRRPGIGLLVGLGVLVLGVVVAGVAAFTFLPTADITVRPRIESVGPIALTVRADPAVTTVDPTTGAIPAQVLEVPVEASGEFPATDRRVERTSATGGVRWTNCDNSASYTIPRGTTVSTRDGVGFTTDEAVFLPVAVVTGTPSNPDLKCQSSEVAVTAAKPGPSGNVNAGAIRVIPARYNRNLVSVTNPAPTSGGERKEYPRVSQQDVDTAMEQLTLDLQAQFQAAVDDGAGAPAGTTVFPGTAVLGEPVPTVDPVTLVGQEVESFTLGTTATGQVVAVDASPVEAIAAARLEGSVKPGYTLVDGSTEVEVGEASVVDGVVTFPATGAAQQVRQLDPEALRSAVLGLGEDEARGLLGQYGDVELLLWPDWASSVPGFAQRVTLVVLDPVAAGDDPGTEPVPSG